MKDRINVSVSPALLNEIDEYAEKMHQTRSGFISMCVSQYIQQQEMLAVMPQLLKAYQSLDEESK